MNRSPRQRLVLLAFASALAVTSAARAAEPPPIATAPAIVAPTDATAASAAPAAAPAPLSIGDQIDAYLKSSPAAALPKDNASGVTSGDEPRKMHSIVDVAAGSSGYRSAFVESEVPVGKTSTVTIAVGESQFKGRFDPRFETDNRQSLGLGFATGGVGLTDSRCLQATQEGAVNLDPRFGGERFCHNPDAPPP